MADVTMPRLSDTMEEGKLLRWLKRPGEPVEPGEILAEVETDKADMELEAPASGVLREVRLSEGESAPVGAVIAVIDDGAAGAAPSASAATAERAAAPKPPAAAARTAPSQPPAAAERAAPAPEPPAQGEGGAPAARSPAARKAAAKPSSAAKPAPVPSRPAQAPERGDGAARVSPLARSRAEELRIDPTRIVGTGPGGRVTRADVEAAHRAQSQAPSPAQAERTGEPRGAERPARPTAADRAGGAAARGEAAPAEAATSPAAATSPGVVRVRPPAAARPAAGAPAEGDAGLHVERIPLSRMRASIARRMAESKREAPHFYLSVTIEMEEAVRLRASLKELGGDGAGVTLNHVVLKACADALVRVPEMNARFAGDAIEVLQEVNLGVAIAVDEGLIVPVIHGADGLSLFDLAARARELAERAKSNAFSGNDLSGATFSVSNLGMFGIESFAAVINPPQAGILAVGAVQQRPVVRDGRLDVAHTMHATLSCDHRAVDGARGARFLAEVKRRLESPVSLLVATERS